MNTKILVDFIKYNYGTNHFSNTSSVDVVVVFFLSITMRQHGVYPVDVFMYYVYFFLMYLLTFNLPTKLLRQNRCYYYCHQ